MFLILAMGALVTKADAGRGCGDEWPLCHGKFVPAHTISSFIEYSHRLVVGIVTIILIATFILVFRYVKRKDAKFLSPNRCYDVGTSRNGRIGCCLAAIFTRTGASFWFIPACICVFPCCLRLCLHRGVNFKEIQPFVVPLRRSYG